MSGLRIVFVSSSAFGAPSLRILSQSKDYSPLLVISAPDKPAGRKLQITPTPISSLADELGIPLVKPPKINDPTLLEHIATLEPDLLITASYGEIIGKTLRHIPRLGAINIHPSLLPLYRGATPIQTAIMAGDELTGITIFGLTARMDAGPMHKQITVPILPDENFSDLHDRLAELSAPMLLSYLIELEQGKIVEYPQNDRDATYTHKIEKQDQLIRWNKPADAVHNLIRSLAYTPGAYQYYNGQMLKILDSEPLCFPSAAEPGTVQELIKNKGFTVNCADHQLLIRLVQPQGKSIMGSWAWSLGSRIAPGDKIWN